jgi:TonB family protein
MTPLQKKCFLFSIGMHCLLLVILVGSAAFRDKPDAKDSQMVLTMIPANILDKAGVGGGSSEPTPTVAVPQQTAVQAPTPTPPTPHPVQPAEPVPVRLTTEPVERPKPKVKEIEAEPTEKPVIAKEAAIKPAKKPPHEIVVDHTPASSLTHDKTKAKTPDTAAAEATAAAEVTARADARRRRNIAQTLNALSKDVRTSAAQGTAVDLPGVGGGEAFADYKTVIYNYYFHAWIAPDGVTDKLATADVKIVVARDGAILSAEIIKTSGEPALDKSVERALRAVTSLPAFPPGARDQQRSFLLRFNLEAKEGSG